MSALSRIAVEVIEIFLLFRESLFSLLSILPTKCYEDKKTLKLKHKIELQIIFFVETDLF